MVFMEGVYLEWAQLNSVAHGMVGIRSWVLSFTWPSAERHCEYHFVSVILLRLLITKSLSSVSLAVVT